ncbi:MAG: hypothetical protein ACLSHW_05025 [Lachnospiraceae bacterium]
MIAAEKREDLRNEESGNDRYAWSVMLLSGMEFFRRCIMRQAGSRETTVCGGSI